MAIDHMDDFKMYGTDTTLMLNGIYAQVTNASLVEDPGIIETGTVLKLSAFGSPVSQIRKVLNSTQTTAGLAARFWLSNLPIDNNARMQLSETKTAANTSILSVGLDPTGRLRVYDSALVVLTTTTNPVVTANGWFHIEMKYTQTHVVVRVEGAEVINFAHAVVAPAYAQVSTTNNGPASEPDLYTKDYVIWDGSGSLNNDFLGSVIVYGLVTTADAALNWTPVGAANGFSILDNSPPNDASYISAPSPGIPAAYEGTMSDLPSDVSSVRAVMTKVRARKSDGGDGSLQNGVISGASTGNGANRPITTTFTYWQDVFETDPNTSSPWLKASVDAVKLRINRTL